MISQSRYIKIVSGVGAGASVAQRQLTLRLITQNALMPPGVVLEFANADAVGSYFGTTSEEYARAVRYFKFVNKNISSPASVSFARWVNAAIAPSVVGDSTAKSLALLKTFTTGIMSVVDGGATKAVTGLDFSGAATLTAVAATLQTALRAVAAAPQLATCSVTYNTNTNQFVLTGTTTGSGTLSIIPSAAANDVSAELGWGTSGTIYVPGQAAGTAVDAITNSVGVSNNFGSFAFCTPSVAMANADIAAVATWNDAQNNVYIYAVATPLSNLSALFALVKGNSGTALHVLSSTMLNDYIEQSPCEILAATDYSRPNASQNYMYNQFPSRNVTVSDDATADTVDASRGNYIGVTQMSGQQLAFYQRGVLCGGTTSATDIGTYANEMWLKSDISSKLMGLFLSVGRVPANDTGASMLLAVIQQSIDMAKTNGTISAGKSLSATQQQYVTQISGDVNAWRQVSNIGYWISVSFASKVTTDGRTEWTANYVLIYSKDDAVRSVNGSDVMI